MEIIEALIDSPDRLRTRDLAEHFGIGQNLLANDLNYLETIGQLERHHGWVRRRPTEVDDFFSGTEFSKRRANAPEEKQAIARYVAAQLPEGGQVLLDGGSTALAVGEEVVRNERKLELHTNNLPLALLVAKHSFLTLHILGGEYDRDDAATAGSATAEAIVGLKADAGVLTPRALAFIDREVATSAGWPGGRAILGWDGAGTDTSSGSPAPDQARLHLALYGTDATQYPYKSMLIKNANKLFICADASKLGATGQCFFTAVIRPRLTPGSGQAAPAVAAEGRGELLLPVRARGPVLQRRVRQDGMRQEDRYIAREEPAADIRDAESIEIVVAADEDGRPPEQLLQHIEQLRRVPDGERGLALLGRILTVVNREGQPLGADWLG